MAYASFALTTVSFGLERIVLREISKRSDVVQKLLSHVFRSQLVVWIVTLPFMCVLVLFFDYSEQINRTIWFLLLFWLLPATLFLVVDAAHQGLENMGISSILGVISALQILLLAVVVLLMGGGLIGIAAVMVWERLSTTLLGGFLLLRRPHGLELMRHAQKEYKIRSLLREGVPFVALGLFGTLYQRVDVLLMPMFVSSSEIGQYATAYRMLEALLILPAVIATAAFPVMIKTLHSDFSSYREVAGKSMRFGLVIAGLVVGVLFVVAEPIIVFVFGEEFQASANLFQVLLWGLFFQSVNNTLGRSMIAANLEKFFIPLSGIALTSNVLLNLYLLPRMGAMGASIATLGSYAVSTFLHCLIVWKGGVMPEYRKSLLAILSFAIAGIVVFLLKQSGVGVLSLAVGLLVYITCLFSFGVLSMIRFSRQVVKP